MDVKGFSIEDEKVIEHTKKIAEHYSYERLHSRQVAYLALKLFDELEPLHGLGSKERLLTYCGGLLHDVGWIEGGQGHHKNSMKLIMQTKELPFDDNDKVMLALIARYHRKSLPKPGHKYYGELKEKQKRRVDWGAALVRLADGLDRSHGKVVKNLFCQINGDKVEVRCKVIGDAAEEQWGSDKKSDYVRSRLGYRFSVHFEYNGGAVDVV